MERQSDKRGVVNPATPHVEVHRSPDVSDAVLASRAAGGDQEAFALLYHRNKHDVWRLASFRLGDAHEAEDALQETFLRAYRALADFHGDGPARPWLLAICRNVCLDRLRSRRARGVAFLEDEGGAEAIAARADVDGGLDLRRALAALSSEDAEAFFFVDVLGLRSHEAAHVLGLRAPSTLRSRLDHARRELARALAPPPAARPGRELWGVFHTPPERALVVAHSDARAAGGPVDMAPAQGAGQLVRFFDTLEHQIPAGHRVVAVLGAPPAGCVDAAVPWITHHPRWRLRVSSGDSWRRDAESALSGNADAAALAQLRTDHPFVWTPTR
jgi:RNA polymerase sigma-70 factor (ECF subfamily)